MKAYLKVMTLVMMLAAMSLGLAACGDDKDDNMNSIIGYWSDLEYIEEEDTRLILKIDKDGSFILFDTDGFHYGFWRGKMRGNWSIKDDKLVLNPTETHANYGGDYSAVGDRLFKIEQCSKNGLDLRCLSDVDWLGGFVYDEGEVIHFRKATEYEVDRFTW